MRYKQSEYMQWAKTRSRARFNLATSGVGAFPLSELGEVPPLEINGDNSYGYPPLKRAIAGRYGVDANCVVTAAGTSGANYLALATLLDAGDEVLIEHPTYGLLEDALGYVGAVVKRFARTHEGGYAVDAEAVRRAVTPRTKLIVVTNLHNPSSVLTGESVLREIGEIARSVGARVLVDEVYLDAVFDQTLSTAFHLGPEFVVTNSLTKVYGLNGLRCGWILAEPALARRIWLLNDLFEVNAAHPAERLSCIALANIDVIRTRSRALLDANRPLLNQFFAERKDLVVRPLEFGTVAFPRLMSGPVDRFCDLLRAKYEATVVPGSFFEMPEHFRVGIATETAVLAEGLQRVGSALDEFSGRRN